MSAEDTFIKPDAQSVTDAPRRPSRWARPAGIVAGIVLVIGVLWLGFRFATRWNEDAAAPPAGSIPAPESASTPAVKDVWQRTAVEESGLADRIGVQIKYVAITGGGGLIDLRYQVVDPEKANILHSDENPPILIDEATGAVVDELLMGHSHSGTFNGGQTYYLIFNNPGNLVKNGSAVSVLLGDARVDHVIVR